MYLALTLIAALVAAPQQPSSDDLLGSASFAADGARAARTHQTLAPSLGNAPLGATDGRPAFAAAGAPAEGTGHGSAALGVRVVGSDAQVVIRDWVARTELTFTLSNPLGREVPTDFIVPLPDGAAVSQIAYSGDAAEPATQILPAAQARLEYDGLVRHAIDPALLEFVGWDAVRTSVFPVPPGDGFRVRLTYEHELTRDSTGALRYTIPRSTLLDRSVPLDVKVNIRSWDWIKGIDVFSPTHGIRIEPGPMSSIPESIVRLASDMRTQAGSFELFLRPLDPRGAAGLFTFTDADDQRYGLVRFTPGPDLATGDYDRCIVLALDRSGSMRGEKFEQARAGAIAIVQGLADGERLNVVDYSDSVTTLWAEPRALDAAARAQALDHLENLTPGGGTNFCEAILTALDQAMRPEPEPAEPVGGERVELPLVLALTDGLPTAGTTDEHAIRAAVAARLDERPAHGSRSSPRVFALGVGYDVNAPLLDSIASRTRAVTHYVRPGEDTERALTEVFADLEGPVLTDVRVEVVTADGVAAPQAFVDVHPRPLPDLFAGDALTVAGRLHVEDGLRIQVHGRSASGPVSFDFVFDERALGQQFAFVPRLWATRRIAHLTQLVRDLESRASTTEPDPRFAELSDEILHLSLRFGVLSEYSSFLVLAGTDLTDARALVASNRASVHSNAVDTRSGAGQVAQGMNWNSRANATCQNLSNDMVAFDGSRVNYRAVQALDDRAFLRTFVTPTEETAGTGASAPPTARWIDGRLVENDAAASWSHVVERSSADYAELVRRLSRQNRASCLALDGEVLVEIDGEAVLVR